MRAPGLQELERAVGGERAELERLDARRGVGDVGALGEQHGDAVGAEPPAGEPHRLERRLVEPLQVVDHAQHRAFLGGQREQPEQRGADRQPRLRGGRLELQRAGERRRLGLRQPVAQAEHRLAQLGQAGERQLRLALQAAHPQHRHPAGALDRRAQQRRLPDPGLPAQHDHVAAARAGGVQRALDALELRLTTDQHRHVNLSLVSLATPIVLADGLDLTFYSAVADVWFDTEPRFIEQDYRLYDATGRRLELFIGDDEYLVRPLEDSADRGGRARRSPAPVASAGGRRSRRARPAHSDRAARSRGRGRGDVDRPQVRPGARRRHASVAGAARALPCRSGARSALVAVDRHGPRSSLMAVATTAALFA